MPVTRTRSSTPRLSELARQVAVPAGVVSTGWPAVEGKCADLGITFRSWQHGTGQLILAKRADGKYAATIGGTGMSIPRQVGKTYLVGAIVFALCLLRPGLTVIWTAHRLRTAEETFGKMQAFARRSKIKPHVEKVWLGSGEEEIRFHNGSRIMFGARERGFGRGFDEVDVLVFDEAQILTDSALDDMIPATNQSRQDTGALLLFMGTPPKLEDKGDVFRRMRTEANSGEDEDTAWIEFGADVGFMPTESPAPLEAEDWAQVAKANPSFPLDTPREAILRMRKKLGPDSFLREGLGLWTNNISSQRDGVFGDLWLALADPNAPRGDRVAFGVAVAPDGTWSAIAVAWVRPDGAVQVQVTDYRLGAEWLSGRMQELREAWGGTVTVSSSARGLVADALEPTQAVQAQAHVALEAAVRSSQVRHGYQSELNVSVKSARWKSYGDSRMFDRKGAADISPLDAVALAMHGVHNSPATDGWMVSL